MSRIAEATVPVRVLRLAGSLCLVDLDHSIQVPDTFLGSRNSCAELVRAEVADLFSKALEQAAAGDRQSLRRFLDALGLRITKVDDDEPTAINLKFGIAFE